VIGVVLILLGIAIASVGYIQFRRPWARYKALKAQDENIVRYESWRGGLRDSGTTGASVAMDILRAQARNAAIVAGAGVAIAILGLLLT
jgi:hypothetical protein